MDQFGSWGKIVVVEDNPSLAEIYKTRLEAIGYICFVAYDGIDAIAIIEKERPSLVLLDLMVPKLAGDQILRIMRTSDWGKDIKVFIISNLNESDAPAGLRDQGIEGYAVKANLSNDQIDVLVDNILKPDGQQAVPGETQNTPT
jgi:DNA-binding response OmpR family regulator